MEIITGVERRRRSRDEEKLRILAELDEPGVNAKSGLVLPHSACNRWSFRLGVTT